MNRRVRDGLRRKGTTLLRDWGTCPDCQERGSLAVSIPSHAGSLVVIIDCRSPDVVCSMKREVLSEYLVRLGASADRVRRWLELKKANEDRDWRKIAEVAENVARDLRDDPGARRDLEDLQEKLKQKMAAEKDERRIFGISWDDLMGRRG